MTNPIHKALSVMQDCHVRYLLMGGQACILYGGAEFSRDIDLAVLASPDNLNRLRDALAALQASVIAVPRLETAHLKRGHAVHFRCAHPEAAGLRIDVMSVMRGLDSFEELWHRRTTMELEPGFAVDALALPDLVKAKKTQRDKDWPMIRRLLEADYARARANPTEAQVRFWFRECRTPALLCELANRHAGIWREERQARPLLALAQTGTVLALEQALLTEELQEREVDRRHWEPLRKELEHFRHDPASA